MRTCGPCTTLRSSSGGPTTPGSKSKSRRSGTWRITSGGRDPSALCSAFRRVPQWQPCLPRGWNTPKRRRTKRRGQGMLRASQAWHCPLWSCACVACCRRLRQRCRCSFSTSHPCTCWAQRMSTKVKAGSWLGGGMREPSRHSRQLRAPCRQSQFSSTGGGIASLKTAVRLPRPSGACCSRGGPRLRPSRWTEVELPLAGTPPSRNPTVAPSFSEGRSGVRRPHGR
mmetsp:Transcript_15457/g.48642  ORF Transcript_15457/g.48642 Transcript_15457/m.48642 type:complete len:226 (-) Transcript_15457:54-731(-)